MSFKINDNVVLVDDKWPETVVNLYDQLPELNHTYVVRAVRVGVKADELIMDHRRVLESSLLLVGVFNRTNKLGVEAGFGAHRFRKLDELTAEQAAALKDGKNFHDLKESVKKVLR